MAKSYAQVHTLEDTLSAISPEFYKALEAERNKRQKSDSLYLYSFNANKLHFTQSSIAQLIADTTRQAAMLQLKYSNYKRHFKLPVAAFKTDVASLYTEGFTTIGKAKIMGKFYFDKVWDDSLANNLGGDLQNGEPFTHFALKAGKYERQNINFEAGIGYFVFRKLYFTSLLNYDYHWSTGSVDPRPDNKLFHLEYTPGLSYQFMNTTIGAVYSLGKKNGTYDIKYKNRMFSTSQLYPERRLYLNNGYGYIAQYSNAEAYSQSKDKTDSWGVNLATKLAGWHIKANYSNALFARENFDLTSQTSNIDNPIKKIVHSKYEMVTQKLDALIYNDNIKRSHQVSFNGFINEGTGILMSSPTGANYLFDEHSAFLQYLLSLKRHNTIKTELGLNAGATHFTKKDFLASHFYENTTADISLQFAQYIHAKNQQIKISASPGISVPLENNLSVPLTQVNVFTRNIVYPEYDFGGSSFFNGKLSIVYYTPRLLRIAGSSLVLDLNYLQKITDSDINKEVYQGANGSKNQLQVSLGFQIFL
ncbi:DUF6850 family outer membrane beta-barrel protein [Niabella sp. CJ426]|uniref:DUF6850 family outer membrane beta-barrel protein n=1 Tax=Niabella sp. CJ426 TaxID=3393740 RepID=UPI003D0536E7